MPGTETRGRKAKPVALKKVEGTFREDRHPSDLPTLAPGRPPLPDDLEGEVAVRVWAETCDHLEQMGVLATVDKEALRLLCTTLQHVHDAEAEIADEGMIVESYTAQGNRVLRAHPAVAIRDNAMRRAQSLLGEFGLTPSARSRVGVLKSDKDKKKDKAADYFN